MSTSKLLRRSTTEFITLFFTTMVLFCAGAYSQELKAYRDLNWDLYLEWTALSGREYTVQSTSDLDPGVSLWENHSSWVGEGQTITILVQDSSPGGGGGPITYLPQHFFAITPYYDGVNGPFLGSLIAWTGTDGSPYQYFTSDLYFSNTDPPLLGTDVTDPGGDYRLLLHKTKTRLFPPIRPVSLWLPFPRPSKIRSGCSPPFGFKSSTT